MFTVEMDTDEGTSSTITSLDHTGQLPDVEVIIFDDMVAVRQITDVDADAVLDMVVMTPEQWADILVGMKMPSGVYHRETL